MADNWIKIRKELHTDPAVIYMMDVLDLDEYQVIGRLHKLWSWADSHCENGNALGVTQVWIDRYVERNGFSNCMLQVGWLRVTSNGISFPNYERHMSKNAKKRAKNAERQQRYRKNKRNGGVTAERYTSNARPLPDKIREDINKSSSIKAISIDNDKRADHLEDDFLSKQEYSGKEFIKKAKYLGLSMRERGAL